MPGCSITRTWARLIRASTMSYLPWNGRHSEGGAYAPPESGLRGMLRTAVDLLRPDRPFDPLLFICLIVSDVQGHEEPGYHVVGGHYSHYFDHTASIKTLAQTIHQGIRRVDFTGHVFGELQHQSFEVGEAVRAGWPELYGLDFLLSYACSPGMRGMCLEFERG